MKILISAALALSALALSGCASTPTAPTVSLNPAADANNPACAEVMVRLPDTIDTLERRQTNSQSTAAWGDPTSVIFRCGVEPVTVSQLTCVSASDIDWLIDDSKMPSYRFITFGRDPGIEVIVDSKKIAGVTALETLSSAISKIPATARCSG